MLRIVSQRAASDEAVLVAQKDRLAKQAGAARDQSLALALYESEQRESAVRVGLVSEKARNDRLTLRAPFDGRVLTARMEDLRGRFVAAHTLLCEMGDCRKLVADLPVSERLLSDILPGFPVKALSRQSRSVPSGERSRRSRQLRSTGPRPPADLQARRRPASCPTVSRSARFSTTRPDGSGPETRSEPRSTAPAIRSRIAPGGWCGAG